MKIVFLGTGGGFPSKDRGVSAIAVRVNGEIVLFDCGEGTQRQLMSSPFSYMRIRRIFISHFHGDHFLGIAGLVQSMCLNKRTSPLDIFGPEGTIKSINDFLKLGYFNQTMPVTCHELEGGEVLTFPNYTITALAADHMVPALSFALEEPERKGAFRPVRANELGITEGPDFRRLQNGETITINGADVRPDMVMGQPRKGRKIAYTGDTRPIPELEEFVRGADVLIHESTFHSNMTEKSAEFGHTTSRQAAELAARAGVRKLFLTHISNRYSRDPTPLIEEAEEIFPETELARDFLEYEVPKHE